jgi:nucleoside-diphosphate-sugar epimerase
MRLFVTGATGFIGAHVAERLRALGYEVVALVRSLATAGALRELGCELVEGQLTDGDVVRVRYSRRVWTQASIGSFTCRPSTTSETLSGAS